MEIEEGLEEVLGKDVIVVANAYLQGVLDATPPDERSGVDTWYGYGEYDINVDGSGFHGGDEDALRVLVHRYGDPTFKTLYTGKKK